MPIRHSFSAVTVRELRDRQGLDQNFVISGTRLTHLAEKYGISLMEVALIFTAETVDRFGRIPG